MTVGTVAARSVVESPDGVEIAVFGRGSGPSVLLVHGTGEDHRRWTRVTDGLADSGAVHAVDRRGRGASGDGNGYRLGAEAADLVAVVRRLGGRVVLVAHSYGAICALEAAVHLPDLRGLLLYEPPVPVASSPSGLDVAARIRAAVTAGDDEEGLCLFLGDVIGIPRAQVDLLRRVPGFGERAAVARTIPREIEATADHVVDLGRLSSIRTPTLLVSGETSAPDLREAARMLAASLPSARLTVLPGQGHTGMDSAPRLFIDVVRAFLRDEARPPSSDH